nr:MAG TPA: hypothetical protein [Microviridae sp.]
MAKQKLQVLKSILFFKKRKKNTVYEHKKGLSP